VFKSIIFSLPASATNVAALAPTATEAQTLVARWVTNGAQPSRYSYVTQILPYLEQNALYDQCVDGLKTRMMVSHRNHPSTNLPSPFSQHVGVFTCPTDPNGRKMAANDIGRLNYRCSIGDSVFNQWNDANNFTSGNGYMNTRGAFVLGIYLSNSFGSVTDGLSNTIFIAEAAISDYTGTQNIPVRGGLALRQDNRGNINMHNFNNRSDCLVTVGPNGLYEAIDVNGIAGTNPPGGSGRRWGDGSLALTCVVIAVPPNGPSCAQSSTNSERAGVAVSSFHTGGANVCLGDGSVRFVSDSINSLTTGTLGQYRHYTATLPSEFGVWGALGTIRCGEPVSL
jgi:prepilin-type processing-associated H-X9-DG protein